MTVAVQVFFRYVLNHSLFWSEELARYLLVWLTFLGSSSAYYRKAHPGIDFLFGKMPAPLQKIAALCVHMASLSLFCVMIFFGFRFAYFVRLQISPALYLPKWIVFSIIPLSGLLLLIHGLVFIAKDLSGKGRDG
jgi:TRAP-type C4-dicarboxylate transport system permease small subunit